MSLAVHLRSICPACFWSNPFVVNSRVSLAVHLRSICLALSPTCLCMQSSALADMALASLRGMILWHLAVSLWALSFSFIDPTTTAPLPGAWLLVKYVARWVVYPFMPASKLQAFLDRANQVRCVSGILAQDTWVVNPSRTTAQTGSRKAAQTRTARETKHRRRNNPRRTCRRVCCNKDAASQPAWPALRAVVSAGDSGAVRGDASATRRVLGAAGRSATVWRRAAAAPPPGRAALAPQPPALWCALPSSYKPLNCLPSAPGTASLPPGRAARAPQPPALWCAFPSTRKPPGSLPIHSWQ